MKLRPVFYKTAALSEEDLALYARHQFLGAYGANICEISPVLPRAVIF
jgi:hypothetical protein